MPLGWLHGEIAVVGLARSGRAVATLLARTGAEVYASDSESSRTLESTATALRSEGAEVQLGGHDLARIGRASFLFSCSKAICCTSPYSSRTTNTSAIRGLR